MSAYALEQVLKLLAKKAHTVRVVALKPKGEIELILDPPRPVPEPIDELAEWERQYRLKRARQAQTNIKLLGK